MRCCPSHRRKPAALISSLVMRPCNRPILPLRLQTAASTQRRTLQQHRSLYNSRQREESVMISDRALHRQDEWTATAVSELGSKGPGVARPSSTDIVIELWASGGERCPPNVQTGSTVACMVTETRPMVELNQLELDRAVARTRVLCVVSAPVGPDQVPWRTPKSPSVARSGVRRREAIAIPAGLLPS